MDDDVKDGMWVDIPCADHQARKKKCDCPDKKRFFKPFVRNVCARCFKRKKKCTHGLAENPAFKTKRVQEEQPTSYKAPKEPVVGGTKKHQEEEKPTSYKASKEPAAGGKSAVEKEKAFIEDDFYQTDAQAQQYHDEEMAEEAKIWRAGYLRVVEEMHV